MTTAALHDYLKANYKEYEENTSRLDSLYSDFAPAKTSNRYGYDANVAFWKKLLIDTSRAGLLATNGDVLILKTANFEEDFAWKGVGSPMGLACVLAEMQQSGDLIPFDDSMFSVQDTWPMWIFSAFVNGLWGFRRLIGEGGAKRFIVMPTLQDAAIRIAKHQSITAVHGITDNLMTISDFKDKFAAIAVPGAVLSDTDVLVLIWYLEKTRGVLVTEGEEEKMVIKFRSKNDATHKRIDITSTDRGIISIKETCKSLQKQVEEIEDKMTQLTLRAKATLQKSQRSQSLFALKQRKQLQIVLDKRLGSLGTMDEILLKIQGAETDAEIMQAYTVGADTLKSILASTGLTVDSIDETMDRLRDVLGDQQEIDDAMRLATDGMVETIIGPDADEELERELEGLIDAEKAKTQEAVESSVPTSEVTRPLDVPGVDLVAAAEKMDELDGMLARLSVAPEVTMVGLKVAEEEDEAQTKYGEEAREAMLV